LESLSLELFVQAAVPDLGMEDVRHLPDVHQVQLRGGVLGQIVAVRVANLASLEPSVARSIVVGKMLICFHLQKTSYK